MTGAFSFSRRRLVLAGLGALAYGANADAAEQFDAIVSKTSARRPRTYPTLAAALNAAPRNGTRPFRIFIEAGRFREKLVIDKPNIALIGADRDASVLTFDAAAGMPGPDGKPFGTWGCASLRVAAPGFSARNLTIENAFNYIGDLATPKFERIGSNGAQGVALMLNERSDRALLEDVTLIGHQDTLFADSGRALFRRCKIAGSVDFIFGAATALFDHCEIVSRYRPGLQRNHGFITAPSTPRAQPYGLVFLDCRLTREPQVPLASVVLGRPWRPTKQFFDGRYGDPEALGACAYLRCWMDDHISADGWDEMGYSNKDGLRAFLDPNSARFGEYASEGPGAFVNRRRSQLSPAQAEAHAARHILKDWPA